MIDTNEKRYISDLCASVYGIRPNDVVAAQQTFSTMVSSAFSMSNTIELGGIWFIKHFWFAHSKRTASMQNFIAFGVQASTSKSMQTREFSDAEMLAKFMRITSSETGDVDIVLTGYKCIW